MVSAVPVSAVGQAQAVGGVEEMAGGKVSPRILWSIFPASRPHMLLMIVPVCLVNPAKNYIP